MNPSEMLQLAQAIVEAVHTDGEWPRAVHRHDLYEFELMNPQPPGPRLMFDGEVIFKLAHALVTAERMRPVYETAKIYVNESFARTGPGAFNARNALRLAVMSEQDK